VIPFTLHYWTLPVMMTNESSPWVWLAPILAFVGTVLLFAGALINGWWTNDSASERQRQALEAAQTQHDAHMAATQRQHEAQLAAMRAEGAADRAAQRADKLREDVASVLAERWPTLDAAIAMADAADEYRRDRESPDVSARERAARFSDVRKQQRDHFNRLMQLTIRASLLTNDAEVTAILGELRDGTRRLERDFPNHQWSRRSVREGAGVSREVASEAHRA
jgi:flagellar biosynthesis GTPase FlhF